jgi:DNA-binding transcriptional LysR family regulator
MLNLTLRQLRIFEAVARCSSFSRAADELHLTQPAVSMQVKQLELIVDMALFEQIGKKIHLTDGGRELALHARSIARQLRQAEEALQAMKGLTRGRLNIAVVSVAKYFAPQLLAKFCEAHPGITLKLVVNNREFVVQQIADNEVDLAIMGRPPQELDCEAEPFARNPHVMIASPRHPLAGKRRIPLAKLANETFVVREAGSGTRSAMERFFAKHNTPLNAAMEMNSNETIKQAVQADMGVSFMSLHSIGLELEAKRLAVLDVVGLPVVGNWYAVHLRDKRLSPLAEAFRAFLATEAAAMLGDERTRKRRR